MSITEISIKRPLLITVIFVTMILFGFISYKSMNYSLLPKFDASIISVMTVYRGASSEEVQNSVTKPIEEAVSAIEGVDIISATSREGLSMVVVQLKPGIETIVAQRDAERKINQIRAFFPEEVDDPVVNRFNTDEFPVLQFSTNAKMAPKDLFELMELKIKPELSNVKGVGNINLVGGVWRQIDVKLNNEAMKTYGVPAALVYQVLSTSNTSYPAGAVESDENRFSLRMDAKATRVEELRNLVVRSKPDGSRVYLRDVADVVDGESEFQTINRINGKTGLGVMVSKQADANTVEVSEGVKKKLEDLKERYKDVGFDYEIAIDQSTYTLKSAEGVQEDLMLAIIIVAVVMLLFLHSVRSSTFVLVSLPSAMIPTFIMMYAMGFSLNLMTLMALSLVVGILVDDSIVVLENIYRHLEMGKNKVQAALDGRKEIGFTALAITLVDIVVFVPMALSGGMIGNILREFSLVVVFSTLMSLFVSFTLTPLMASRWGRIEILKKSNLWGRFHLAIEAGIESLTRGYANVLRWTLRHKVVVLVSIFVLFIGSFMFFPLGFIGSAFVAQGDNGEFNLMLEMDQQTPLHETSITTKRVEDILLAKPEVVKLFTSVGITGGTMGLNVSSANNATIAVKLVPKEERKISTDEFSSMIRDEVSKIPGVKVVVQIPGITGTSEAPIQIAVKGSDMDSIWPVARQVHAIVKKTAGTDYVEYGSSNPKPELEIRLDKEKMSLYGLSTNEVGAAVQLAFRGNDQTKFKEGGNDYNIRLAMDNADRLDEESVKALTLVNMRGAAVRLEEFATVKPVLGQAVLERLNRLNMVKITATGVGRPNGTIVEDIQREVDKLDMPAGVEIQYLGEAQRQAEAFGNLGIAMAIGFLLVYLILVALYESVMYPLVVMFSIPVAMIGSFTALALTMESMTIFAIVGMIMLLGLVAKNGILLVDFSKHLLDSGRSLTEALIEAGKERLRPILMTTLAMIAGMMPIALATGAGAEVKSGMAWVIIGGLTSSLVLTLVLVPTMFYIMTRIMEKFRRIFGKKDNKASTSTTTATPMEIAVVEKSHV
jgi:hydrophobic/amphiphilic exporter-1 (mainly G- bacteria), HAE1 family